MSGPALYHPKMRQPIEAMQWTGDWEAVSMWVYGEVLDLEVDDDEDDPECDGRPVIRDGCGGLSVLDVDLGEVICPLNDWLVKVPAGWGTFDADEFTATYEPVGERS